MVYKQTDTEADIQLFGNTVSQSISLGKKNYVKNKDVRWWTFIIVTALSDNPKQVLTDEMRVLVLKLQSVVWFSSRQDDKDQLLEIYAVDLPQLQNIMPKTLIITKPMSEQIIRLPIATDMKNNQIVWLMKRGVPLLL